MIDINNIPKILPFKDDYIFKSLLTNHDTGLIRNSMISAFTGLKIVSSEIAENEPAAENVLLEKPVRFDVNCVTDDGTKVQIEMQAHRMPRDNSANGHKNLRVRSLYYMGKLFTGQCAEIYSDMNKAIQIMICDFPVFEDERFIHKFYYKDNDTMLSDYCSIIYVELPKIKKSLSKPVDEMTDDERWAVFIEFANESNFKEKAVEFESRKEFKQAMESLSKVTQSERDYNYYMSRLKYEMDTAQERHDLMEEGMERGIQKGIQIGANNALIKTAMRLLNLGLSPEMASQAVELPLADIEALQKQL
jgi:predicted transposase/invertase (TIGR01784 family)